AGGAADRIDCRGATVLPGIVDPHLHLVALATRGAHLDCGGFRGLDELLAAIRLRAAGLPSGAWLRGEGLDEVQLGGLPTAAELDRASAGAPVRVRPPRRPPSVLSGAGLRRLGRRPGVELRGGHPTGLVHGQERAISRVVGPLPRSVVVDGLAGAAMELASLGVTTVADATPRTWASTAPLREAMASRRVPLRVFAMRAPGSRRWNGERPSAGPVKLMVEEGPGGMRPAPAVLARRIARAAADGPVAVHCLGATTLVAALAGFAALPRALRARGPHRLEHVAECPPPLVRRIAALGLTVVTNPAFVRVRGDVYRAESDPAAWSSLYRARSLAAAGVPLAARSGAPPRPPRPRRRAARRGRAGPAAR